MISMIVYITICTFNLSLVDCWDGGDNYGEEPIIYHGWTMTSKILFKDVIQDAIKKYAFFKSDYPLILSIENHCSIEYQDKMASHLEEILGEMLYNEKVDESLEALPSPEDLKGKVSESTHAAVHLLPTKYVHHNFKFNVRLYFLRWSCGVHLCH